MSGESQGSGPPDPIGGFIRSLATGAAIRVSVLAATVLMVVPALAVFLLSLVPSGLIRKSLGMEQFTGERLGLAGRIERALMMPWIDAQRLSANEFSVSFRLAHFVPFVILIASFTVLGVYVRIVLKRTRSRVTALCMTALIVVFLVGVLAAALSYSADGARYSFLVRSYIWTSLFEVLLFGLISFGLVQRLPEPLRTTFRTAATLFGLLFLLAAIAFPAAILAWTPYGNDHPGRIRDAVDVYSDWSLATGNAIVPLAFGAKAHLHSTAFYSPFFHQRDGAGYTYLPGLARYTENHEAARLGSYAGTGGGLPQLVAVLGALLVVALWILAAVRAVRLLGSPRSIAGLRIGALVGASGFLLLLILKGLTTLDRPFDSVALGVGPRWGVDGGGAFQTGIELVMITGITGLVYAALRPSAYRYQPLSLLRLPANLWPKPEADPSPRAPAQTAAPVDRPQATQPGKDRCATCGSVMPAEAKFCAMCGSPVA